MYTKSSVVYLNAEYITLISSVDTLLLVEQETSSEHRGVFPKGTIVAGVCPFVDKRSLLRESVNMRTLRTTKRTSAVECAFSGA